MNCPICDSVMWNGSDSAGDWGHECKNCGCIVCQNCGHEMKSFDEADSEETRTGRDYFCPECKTQVYSIDLYGE